MKNNLITKRRFYRGCFVSILIFSIVFTSKSYPQHRSDVRIESLSGGDVFLMAFILHGEPRDTDGIYQKDYYQDIYLVGLDDTSIVTITCRAYPIYKKKIVVLPGQTISYRISNEIDLYIFSSEKVEDKVLRITASAPINCYVMDNDKDIEADVFPAVSRSDAGSSYCILSYPGFHAIFRPIHDPYRVSEFIVAAFDANTHITIMPTDSTFTGSHAGIPLIYTLDSGQCIQILAGYGPDTGFGLDLTGSTVTSDKPVAVFSGSNETNIPSIVWGDHQCDGDFLCETLPPVTSWGKNYVFASTEPDRVFNKAQVRVLALNPATSVKLNGAEWSPPFKAHEYRDTLLEGVIGIESDNPVLVGDFAYDSYCGFTDEDTGSGFFVILPPLEQSYSAGAFFLDVDTMTFDPPLGSEDYRFKKQYVQISTETKNTSNIILDGNLLLPTTFHAAPSSIGGKQYSVATIELETGHHRITTIHQATFVAIAYGEGNLSAYAYPVSPYNPSSNSFVHTDQSTSPISLSLYPNPFTILSHIKVSMMENTDLMIRIVDDLGREVFRVADEKNVQGERIFELPGNALSAGHYTCELRSAKLGTVLRKSIVKIE